MGMPLETRISATLPFRPAAGQAPCRGPLLFSEERQWNGLAGHGCLSGARFFLTMTAIDEVMAQEIYELAYCLRLPASLETSGLPYRLVCRADRCRVTRAMA